MTNHFRTIALFGAAALALAACSPKKEVLPPQAWQAAPAPPAPPAAAPIDRPGTVPPAESVTSSDYGEGQAGLVQAAGSDTIHFALDSYALDETSRQILGGQAEWLGRNRYTVTIEGHADERGTREYNLALGERRANAARSFLAAQGVDGGRMTVISFGKERPAVEGSNEAAWAANRRVVTKVTGKR